MNEEKQRTTSDQGPVVTFTAYRDTFRYGMTSIRSELDAISIMIRMREVELYDQLAPALREVRREIKKFAELRGKGVLQFDRAILAEVRFEEAKLNARQKMLKSELRRLWSDQRKLSKEDFPVARKKFIHVNRVAARAMRSNPMV